MNRLYFHKNKVVNPEILTKIRRKEGLELQSIQVHLSLKNQKFDAQHFLLPALLGMEMITGQKPKLHFCQKPLASLNLRKGEISGLSTRLRGKAAYAFLEKLIYSLLPSLRPFEGISLHSLDAQGNVNFQIPDLISFPEVEQEYLHFQQGLRKKSTEEGTKFLPVDISIRSNAKTPEEGRLLLTAFQFPLVDLEKLQGTCLDLLRKF